LTNTIVLVSSPIELEALNIKNLHDAKIFSFNIQTHRALEKIQIAHEIGETYLSKADKLKIFDLTVSYYDWYNKKEISNDFEFEGINLLSLLDTAELHQHLINCLFDFLLIKRIIEKEDPKEIIATTRFSDIIKSLIGGKTISIKIRELSSTNYLPWDRIQIKFNIGHHPISFYLSRSAYLKIKSTLEAVICGTLNLWYDLDSKEKSVMLLEFNPSTYKDLLSQLDKTDKNIVLINRRRPAIWNLDSIKTLSNSKCKILNTNKTLDKTTKNEIKSATNKYLKKLEQLADNQILSNLFLCEGYSFWSAIRDVLISTYRNRISEYISFLLLMRKFFEKTNVSSIISLNVIGETEKIVLAVNKNRATSIMVEHGFANYTQDLQRYDVLSNYPLLQDKVAVWGEIQQKYLLEQRKFDPNRILIVGSPRHDVFFKRKTKKIGKTQKIILLTIVPITKITGQADTNTYIKFDVFVRELCSMIKRIDKVKLIVKLHPGQAEHNAMIIDLLKNIDSQIPVYHLTSIMDLIESCDIMININPESCDTSTVIMEGLIMGKPIITAFLDDKYHEIEFVKDNATISISDRKNLEKILRDVLFDNNTRQLLKKNTESHLQKYLANQGTSSKNLADILNSA